MHTRSTRLQSSPHFVTSIPPSGQWLQSSHHFVTKKPPSGNWLQSSPTFVTGMHHDVPGYRVAATL